MTRLYSLILILCIALSSCVKEYVPAISDPNQQLFVSAEIETGTFQPEIIIESTFANNQEPIEFNDNLLVDIYVEGVQNPIQFRQHISKTNTWVATPELKLREGGEYILKIDPSVFEIEAIESQTRIPVSTAFEINESTFSDEISIELTLDRETNGERYFHLIPYIIDDNQNEVFLDIIDNGSNLNAVELLSHRYGMLIDSEILSDGKTLSFLAKNLPDVNIGALNQPYLYIKLKTVTEDYYLYHQSLNRQAQTNQSPFTLPTITYSNIENGFGLFTVYSSKLDSIKVQ